MKHLMIGIVLGAILTAVATHAQVASVTHLGQTPKATVTNLPSCNATSDGQPYLVTDALTPVLGGIVVGGGALKVSVHCYSGTGWVIP